MERTCCLRCSQPDTGSSGAESEQLDFLASRQPPASSSVGVSLVLGRHLPLYLSLGVEAWQKQWAGTEVSVGPLPCNAKFLVEVGPLPMAQSCFPSSLPVTYTSSPKQNGFISTTSMAWLSTACVVS